MRPVASVVVTAALIAALPLRAAPAKTETPPAGAFRLVRLAVDPQGGGDATLAPDGKRFLSTSKRSGNWEVWEHDIASGRWTQLTDHPAEDFEARYSPDGRVVAFTSDRDGAKNVWTLRPETGELKQLTSFKDEAEYPDFTADGRFVTFTGGPWGTRDFFLVPILGGEPRRLSRQSGRAGACSKGDASSLVCHRYDGGSGDVVRLWLADGQETPLTGGTPWDYKPTLSPDDKWVAFSRSTEGPSQIWVLPLADGRPRRLTRTPYNDRWPTWSADGSKLFFHRVVERGLAVKSLEPRTGNVRTLVGAAEAPLQASLSPDGRLLAYCAQRGAAHAIRVLDLPSGATRTLDTGGREACYPRWSPDGTRLAFASRPADDARWEISVARADGSERVELTEGQRDLRGMDGPVDWSPDGARLVFHADTGPFEADLWVVDVRTRRLERLTNDPWFDEAPAFTPDGRAVVFMSTRGGNWTWGLYRLTLEGGAVETLAGPDWVEKNFIRPGPGGRLLWSTEDERSVSVVAERAKTGEVRLFAGPADDARWPSYTTDGESIVFTQMEHTVEYWLAENPLGPGSPLRDASAALLPPPGRPRLAASSAEAATGPERSPVDHYHR